MKSKNLSDKILLGSLIGTFAIATSAMVAGTIKICDASKKEWEKRNKMTCSAIIYVDGEVHIVDNVDSKISSKLFYDKEHKTYEINSVTKDSIIVYVYDENSHEFAEFVSKLIYTDIKKPERIEKMAKLMDELDIPYTWEVFTDKKEVDADFVGADEYADIAVLKVDKKNIKEVAITGDNSKMRVGDTTFAVGAPLDSDKYSWSVTRGILSGKDRTVSTGNSYMTVLQTDTPINSGNSGGPLCNANGEVIGITNMKLVSSSIEGMSFAIPIDDAINQFVNLKDYLEDYGEDIY